MTSISVTPQDVTIEIQIIFLQISGFFEASFSFLICFILVGSVSSENEDRADNMWIIYTQLLSKPDAIHIIKRAKESAYIERLQSNNQHSLQSVCITISLQGFF